MQTNSKRKQILNRKKEKQEFSSNIDSDISEFKQDGKSSSKNFTVLAQNQKRYTDKIKQTASAYGVLNKMSLNQKSRSFQRDLYSRKSETQVKKNLNQDKKFFHQQQNLTINTDDQFEMRQLNKQIIMTSQSVDIQQSQKQKLLQNKKSIATKQVRISSRKKLADSNQQDSDTIETNKNPSKKFESIKASEQLSDSPIINDKTSDKEKRKLLNKNQERTVEQKKLREIYNKIRNPNDNNKLTSLTTDTYNPVDSPSKIKSKNAEEYIEKLTNKKNSIKIEEKNLSYIESVLSGKMSIIWIFAIKVPISQEIKDRIYEMYNGLTNEDLVVPLFDNPRKIKQYMNIPNCYFKIVTDVENAQLALGFKIYQKVIEIYIYNHERKDNIQKVLQLKNATRKVKGIFSDWQKILNRAEQEVDEQISLYKVNEGLERRQKQRKFPNFLKLTDTDKTDATLYRINLYGAIKLPNSQKKQNLKHFLELIQSKYGSIKQQKQNIKDYKNINHTKQITELNRAKQIIQFYVRESFYYQIINSMLRTMKTVEQFKPSILPFNQTYQSIKLYYEHFLQSKEYKIPQLTLYRGCRMSKRNFNQLKEKIFIEMFGFMSTSKSKERAQQFVDKDGFIFVIHIKSRLMKPKYKNFDHGFVDINSYKLAPSGFQRQQQILFNALNVYQVRKIQQNDDGYTYIHLDYGVIFDLLEKSKEQLKPDQYDTLVNYHYCTKILGKIQDQGDVFLFANQLQQAKKYYDKKIQKGQNLAHNHYKLANVQKQCGQIDQAEQNANKALKLYGNQIDMNDRQTCLKIFGIHTKNAQINLEKQDYLTADEAIDKALEMLSDDQIFERGVKLRQRGQIKFKKGQVKNAQSDFQQSEHIFENLKNQAQIRKIAAYKTYYLSHLSLICSTKTRGILKQELDEQLCKIGDLQVKISQINDDIEDELVKINKSLKDVSLYVEDRDKYEVYVKKARSYLFSIQARKANDPQLKAKLLSMQAMIADYQQLAQSQRLMNQAIQLIQSKNPYDMKVAEYSKILAKMQKAELQKYTNPGKTILNQKPLHPITYNKPQRTQVYERCKNNFKKTLTVLMYHCKDKSSPQILQVRNQLGDLSFNEADYQQCEKTIAQIKNVNNKTVHSEMAKTYLLMGKISLARGQLKNAFESLEEGERILKDAIVTKHTNIKESDGKNDKRKQKHNQIFEKSDIYLMMNFTRITIYHKQKNHDLALKTIQSIERSIEKKVGLSDSHPLLGQLLEVRGGIEVFLGNIYGFDDYFERAIALRQKQFGFYHPVNAKTYCIYSKYLIMVKDVKRAQKMLEKALQIISAYDQNNPNYWMIYFTDAFFHQNRQTYDTAQSSYKKSLKWVKQHLNKSHITIKQIMLRYANILNKSQKMEESLEVYEQLEKQLEIGIRQSNSRIGIVNEIDDQKVSLTKMMYNQLSASMQQSEQMSDSKICISKNLATTNQKNYESNVETSDDLGIKKSTSFATNHIASLYKTKLNWLRNTYNIKS